MTGKVLLTGGCVLTLGSKTPNLAQADLLIDDGVIAEVGPGLRARDAEPVDATDTIVMPGFIDTHRHVWKSLFRNRGSGVARCPSPIAYQARRHLRRHADRAARRGRGRDHHRRRLVAGARRRAASRRPRSRPTPTRGCARCSSTRAASTRPRARSRASSFGCAVTSSRAAVWPRDADAWADARARGLRIHAHGDRAARDAARSPRWRAPGLLGEDVTLVHCSDLDDADIEAIASSGAAVSLSPSSEMAGGHGSPPIQQLDRSRHPAGAGDRRRARVPGRHVRADAGGDLAAARHRLRSQAGRQGRRAAS